MPRNCLNKWDSFCCVCVEVTFKFQRKTFIALIKKCYELYFGCNSGDEEKFWTLHICCATCVRILNGWKNGSRHIAVAVPLVSEQPTDLSSNCYFCLTDISGISSKSKYMVTYPNLPSAMRPVPPVPKPPNNVTRKTPMLMKFIQTRREKELTLIQHWSILKNYFITQAHINDLVLDLNLSKSQAEILASRLKGCNLLQQDAIMLLPQLPG